MALRGDRGCAEMPLSGWSNLYLVSSRDSLRSTFGDYETKLLFRWYDSDGKFRYYDKRRIIINYSSPPDLLFLCEGNGFYMVIASSRSS